MDKYLAPIAITLDLTEFQNLFNQRFDEMVQKIEELSQQYTQVSELVAALKVAAAEEKTQVLDALSQLDVVIAGLQGNVNELNQKLAEFDVINDFTLQPLIDELSTIKSDIGAIYEPAPVPVEEPPI